MKILVLNYEFPPLGGGASPVSYFLAKQYVKLGHSVDVITMSYKGLEKVEKKEGMTIYRVPCLRSKKELCNPIEMLSYLMPAFLKSYKLHKQNKYDINHTHFIIPTAAISYILKKLTGLEYVITPHGSDVPGYNTDRFIFLHNFTRPFLKAIAKNAKAILSPSNYLKNLIYKNITKDVNAKTIPNGVDTKEYVSGKKEKIIFTAGRALKRKGYQHIIKAIKDEKLDWTLHIAGDGPYLAELKKLAKGSKTKIVFEGWVDKKRMKQLYKKAGMFILVSEKENASMVLIEAMSAGCALISTNVSGNPELVSDAGLLVDYADVDNLNKAIKTIIKSPKKYQAAATKRKKQYEITHVVKMYEKELEGK